VKSFRYTGGSSICAISFISFENNGSLRRGIGLAVLDPEGFSMLARKRSVTRPVHPVLMPFPIIFYSLTFLSFVIHVFFVRSVMDPNLFRLGVVFNALGITTALIVAIPGLFDLVFAEPRNSKLKREGYVQLFLNLMTILFFTVNLGLVFPVRDAPAASFVPIVLSGLGLATAVLALLQGRLLFFRLGVSAEVPMVSPLVSPPQMVSNPSAVGAEKKKKMSA